MTPTLATLRTQANRVSAQLAFLLRTAEQSGLLRARLEGVAALTARAAPDLFASDALTQFEQKVFSQNGEDGVIVELFNRIGVTNRYFVEFGIETGSEGNCVFLADVLGWSGLFMEGDPAAHERLAAKYSTGPVATRCAMITPTNIDEIFTEAGVPEEPDIVSIDIDGNDIWVWHGIRKFNPRVVIVEYNSVLDPESPICQSYHEMGWNLTAGFGASLAALDTLAARRGYTLVHSDLAGVNAFYVRNDLVDRVGVTDVPRRKSNFRLEGKGHVPGEPDAGWVTVTADTFAD